MTNDEFDTLFDTGELDCDFAMYISERYDAWSKHQMLSYWEDPDTYIEYRDSYIQKRNMLQDAYFEGKDPLDSFPTIRG